MADGNDVSREHLAELLNEDLAREYQAIIGYVVYSQVLSGAQYMDIAAQLEIHAKQELDHALIISRQIDYLGKMPAVNVTPRARKAVREPLRSTPGAPLSHYREASLITETYEKGSHAV